MSTLMTLMIDKKLKEKQRRIYKTYGLKWDEYQEMISRGCYICGTHEGRLCVDHVHIRGYSKMLPEERRKYVRGILCFIDNVGLKGFEKTADGVRNRKQLEGTYRYFKTYPLKGEI